MTNQQRAGIIAFAQSLLPVLILAGIVQLNENQISIVMLCVTNAVTLAALFFPAKSAP